MQGPASVLTPPFQPPHKSSGPVLEWRTQRRKERKAKKKKKMRAERGREEEGVAGQVQRKGTDLMSRSLSLLELEGSLWPLVFKCF